MSLIDDFGIDCVFMTQTSAPDGEGGLTKAWVEGDAFRAAITFDRSMQAKVAEKQGVTSLYTVTVDKTVTLSFHDVFKRVADGKMFRVTSDGDDTVTPVGATFAFRQVTAEEWRLTT